jgi:hypothetical protein
MNGIIRADKETGENVGLVDIDSVDTGDADKGREQSASDVSAAEAIAKPFPVAAVVLPTASSLSVRSRTSGGNWLISAIPPALSAIGPKASIASCMAVVDIIPAEAIATP